MWCKIHIYFWPSLLVRSCIRGSIRLFSLAWTGVLCFLSTSSFLRSSPPLGRLVINICTRTNLVSSCDRLVTRSLAAGIGTVCRWGWRTHVALSLANKVVGSWPLHMDALSLDGVSDLVFSKIKCLLIKRVCLRRSSYTVLMSTIHAVRIFRIANPSCVKGYRIVRQWCFLFFIVGLAIFQSLSLIFNEFHTNEHLRWYLHVCRCERVGVSTSWPD